MRPGKTPRTLDVLTTNAMGRVKLKNTYAAGRFFAVAKWQKFADEFGRPGTCLKAESAKVQVPKR